MPSTALKRAIIHEMRPVLRIFDQAGTHGILPDIVGLELQTFIGPHAVIKIVSLPVNPHATSGKPFPIANHFRQVLAGWKASDQVQVIRHQQKQVQDPALFGMIKDTVREQSSRGGGQTKLIQSARLTTKRDEKPRAVGHEAGWNVIEGFALVGHARKFAIKDV